MAHRRVPRLSSATGRVLRNLRVVPQASKGPTSGSSRDRLGRCYAGPRPANPGPACADAACSSEQSPTLGCGYSI